MRIAYGMVALLVGMIVMAAPAAAELEMSLAARQAFDRTPLDIAQSVSDGRLFVLLEGGEVRILSPAGEMQERLSVGAGVTGLEVSPDGQRLYLLSTAGKELQFVDMMAVYVLPENKSPVRGPAKAPVTITVFSDFQCPYCARLVPTLDQVVEAYPKQVKLIFKQFPLSMHQFARPAALASLAARNQGKFWPLHDKLFANYNQLSDEKIRELASSVGLDMARYDKDVADPALLQEVAADFQLGTQSEVRGTPAVYINGRPLRDRSIGGFKQAIDAVLKKAGK